MKPYKILDHTADVKFEVYASGIEELLNNICLAFSDFVCEECDDTNEKEILKYDENLDDFIFDFISDMIYFFDAKQLIPRDVKILNVNLNDEKGELLNDVNISLKLEIRFCKCKNIKHDVKAMTYNDLRVVHNKKQNKYITEFVLDI